MSGISLGDVWTYFRGDDSDVNQVTRRTEGMLQGFSERTSSLLERAFGFVVGETLFRGISRLASSFQDSFIGLNSQLETAQLQFTTLSRDADFARDHVRDLFQFAKDTPFETGPIIEASRQLFTLGGRSLDTMENLRLVGDAAAATSAPLDAVATHVGRMYAAFQGGQAFGESLMRLRELGVIGPEAAQKLQQLQQQGANFETKWKALREELTRFNGAMLEQANTWSGLTSTLSDVVSLAGAQIFKPFFDLAKDGIRSLNELASTPQFQQWITNAAQAMQGIADRVREFASSAYDLAQRVLPVLESAWQRIGPVVEAASQAIQAAFQVLGDIANDAYVWGANIVNEFASGLASAVGSVTNALSGIGETVSYWLSPGSPPRLLPKLPEWGAAAAREFFGGFSDADFSALEAFGQQISDILQVAAGQGKMSDKDALSVLLGSREQFAMALDELNRTGSVSEATFAKIRASAGAAGEQVEQAARAYIDLAKATEEAEQAQKELDQLKGDIQASEAELAAAEARGDNPAEVAARRNELTFLRQKQTAAQKRQDEAQKEIASIQKRLQHEQNIIKFQQEQLRLLQQIASAQEKAANKAGEDAAKRAAEAQWAYNFALADTDTKIAMLRDKLSKYNEGQAEYWQTLLQIRSLEKQKDQENARQAANDARWNLQHTDNADEQIRMLKEQQSQFAEGTDEWRQYQTQIEAIQKKQEADAKARQDAEWAYNYAIADTAGKLRMQQDRLKGLDQGSVEYYQTLTQIHSLEQQLEREREQAEKKHKGAGGAAPVKPTGPKPPTGAAKPADYDAEARRAAELARDASERRIREAANQLRARIASILPRIFSGELVYQAASALLRTIPVIANVMGRLELLILNEIRRIWPQAMAVIGNNLSALILAIGDNAPRIIQALQRWSLAFASWAVREGPGMLREFIFGVVLPVVESIMDAAPRIIDALAEWGAAIIAWLPGAANQLLAQLLELSLEIWGWIKEQAPVYASQLGDWVIAFIGWLPDAISGLLGGLADMLGQIIVFIVENGPGIAVTILQWGVAFVSWVATTAIPALLQALAKLLTNLLNWIVEKGPGILAQLGTWGNQFVQFMIEWLPKISEQFSKLVNDFVSWINREAATLGLNLALWGLQFVQMVIDATPKVIGELGNLLNRLGQWVSQTAPKVASLLVDIGVSIVQGIKDGISNEWAKFERWLRDQMNKIPQPVRDALGIGSPSKVLAKEGGRPIVQGLQMGAEEEMPTFLRFLAKSAGNVANLVSNIYQGLQPPSLGVAGATAAGLGIASRNVLASIPGAQGNVYEGDTITVVFKDTKIESDIDLDQVAYRVAEVIQQKKRLR